MLPSSPPLGKQCRLSQKFESVPLAGQVGFLVLLAFLCAGVATLCTSSSSGHGRFPHLTFAQTRLVRRHILWIDARSEAAFALGHIPGAILLDETHWNALLPHFLAQWKDDQYIVVYCSPGCGLSESVAKRLLDEIGISDVAILEESWTNYAEGS